MKKAFLGELIKTPGGYYYFDTNRNSIVPVSSALFAALQNIETIAAVDQLDDDIKEEIKRLKSNGFFSSNRVEEIEYPLTDFLDAFLDRTVKKITLQLTQKCNFRCSYCIYSDLHDNKQRTHSNSSMTFEVARKAVDFLLEHSCDCSTVNIGFYGGEPLLEFELIKRIVEYAEFIFEGKELTFTYTTNGSLLNQEIAEYSVKHNIHPYISIDGPQMIHDINRRFAADGNGSFKTILQNLSKLHETNKEYTDSMGISMVIDPQNDYDVINSVFEEDVFDNMSIQSTIIDDIDSIEKNTYSEEFLKKRRYRSFLAFLVYFERLDQKYVSCLDNEFVNLIIDKRRKFQPTLKLPHKTAPGGPCLAGRTRLFVDVNGNLFPCERVSETSAVMRIGDVDTGFDVEAIKKIVNIGKLTSDKCRDCWAFAMCSLCAKNADNVEELSGSRKLTFCDETRASIKNELTYIILLDEFSKSRR